MTNLERQVNQVLNDERKRITTRKHEIENILNEITNRLLMSVCELLNIKKPKYPKYVMEIDIEFFIHWIIDSKKGYLANNNRSQTPKQWVNSAKGRKYSKSLFPTIFESLKQYAIKLARGLEETEESRVTLEHYLKCEFYCETLQGSVQSGKGAGNRPVICDGAFAPKNSVLVAVLMEDIPEQLESRFPTDKADRKNFFTSYFKNRSKLYFGKYLLQKMKYGKIRDMKVDAWDVPMMETSNRLTNINTKDYVSKDKYNQLLKDKKRLEFELDQLNYDNRILNEQIKILQKENNNNNLMSMSLNMNSLPNNNSLQMKQEPSNFSNSMPHPFNVSSMNVNQFQYNNSNQRSPSLSNSHSNSISHSDSNSNSNSNNGNISTPMFSSNYSNDNMFPPPIMDDLNASHCDSNLPSIPNISSNVNSFEYNLNLNNNNSTNSSNSNSNSSSDTTSHNSNNSSNNSSSNDSSPYQQNVSYNPLSCANNFGVNTSVFDENLIGFNNNKSNNNNWISFNLNNNNSNSNNSNSCSNNNYNPNNVNSNGNMNLNLNLNNGFMPEFDRKISWSFNNNTSGNNNINLECTTPVFNDENLFSPSGNGLNSPVPNDISMNNMDYSSF